jgi:uncharacterized membrane protein YkoI
MKAMKLKPCRAAFAAGLILCGLTACATAGEGEASQANLEAKAKITKVDAETTALAKAPGGTVKEAELEKEDGVLVWSIDITTPGSKDITEVLVDAKTGKVISTETESAEAEQKEAKNEGDHGEGDKD